VGILGGLLALIVFVGIPLALIDELVQYARSRQDRREKRINAEEQARLEQARREWEQTPGSNDLYDRPDTYWESVASRYRAMSAQDMNVAARGAVDVSRFVWVVVGDAAVVRPQLESLGLAVEVVQP
jgi:hypothetical protein